MPCRPRCEPPDVISVDVLCDTYFPLARSDIGFSKLSRVPCVNSPEALYTAVASFINFWRPPLVHCCETRRLNNSAPNITNEMAPTVMAIASVHLPLLLYDVKHDSHDDEFCASACSPKAQVLHTRASASAYCILAHGEHAVRLPLGTKPAAQLAQCNLPLVTSGSVCAGHNVQAVDPGAASSSPGHAAQDTSDGVVEKRPRGHAVQTPASRTSPALHCT